MRIRLAFLLVALHLCGSAYAASSVRYALIVGNNFGKTPPGVELPELKHAEAEARELRERLVTLGNFDPSRSRTTLLLGKTREEILRAAQTIAEQHRADRRALGDIPTLFTLFFTGHGLSGQLLTATEPLTGADLATIFNEVGATFTVGVFDACFSGSLDLKTLASKGLTLTPGFNVFEALPQEVINAEGTMWFVSSGPDQVSYEDDRLGGVFTHFFIEAMERAPRTGFGITLEELWEYARGQTQRYTSNAARPQTPQKLIRNLTSKGPLYFSFPAPRSAALELEPAIVGRFLVRYESGQLSELVSKERGQPLRVSVYASDVVIEKLDGGGQQHLALRPDETVWIRASSGWSEENRLGLRRVTLAAKGTRLEGLVLVREESRSSGLVDLGYQASVGPAYSALPLHAVSVGLRLDRGWLQARFGYAFGRASHVYDAWRYTTERHGLELGVGPAATMGAWRAGALAVGQLAWNHVDYAEGGTHAEVIWGAGVAADVLWRAPRGPLPWYLHARFGLVAERSRPVAPADASRSWSLAPQLTLGVAAEIF